MAQNEMVNNQNDSGEVSIKHLILRMLSAIRYLKTKSVAILITSMVCGALGLTYAILKKPVYTAQCNFVLEDGKGSPISQYAGLASMAGIDLGGNNGSVFQGDNILVLYQSRRMIEKALLSTANFEGKNEMLIDRFISFNKLSEQWAKKKLSVSFTGNPDNFNRVQDSLIKDIVTQINKQCLNVEKPDKKLDIINVQVTSKDELFAKTFTDMLVQTVNNFYVQTKTKKTYQNVQVLQKQVDSVRALLNSSLSGVASAMDANPNANPLTYRLRVPAQRKQIDVQSNSAIYSEIVKNLELERLSLRQETPLIQVIDNPVLPLAKKRLGKIMGAIIGLVIGFFMSVIFLVLKKVLKSLL